MTAYPLSLVADARRDALPRRTSPKITVVVTSVGPTERLTRCCAAMLSHCGDASVELVVVRAGASADLRELRPRRGDLRLIAAPPTTPLSQLRALGMHESSGDIVVLVDDRALPDNAWIPSLAGVSGSPA